MGSCKKFEADHTTSWLPGDWIKSVLPDLNTGDFFQRDSGPAGYLLKTSAGAIAEPNSYVRKATEASARLVFKNFRPEGDYRKTMSGRTDWKFCRIWWLITTGKAGIILRPNRILKNLYALGILTDLSGHLQDYCRENNIFLLSEASSFLNKVIDNNDAPFVYEKTGNHFHHFMIDEFQDTSLAAVE